MVSDWQRQPPWKPPSRGWRLRAIGTMVYL
jgi:hypothetical protein